MDFLLTDRQSLMSYPNQGEIMKARIFIIQTFLLALTTGTLYSQISGYCECKDKNKAEPALTGEFVEIPKDTLTWFRKEWQLGDIMLSDGQISHNVKLKYNGLVDELFWFEPDSRKFVKLDKEAILRFHFLNIKGDTSINFRKIKVKRDILKDSSDVFGQEIYLGNLSLFILHTFYIEQSEVVTTSKGYFQNDTYAEEPVYIFQFRNGRTISLKSLNRNSLYDLIPDKKEQIKQFFKQTKQVKIVFYSEIRTLLQFLNTLVSQ